MNVPTEPIIARHLTKGEQMLYLIVERIHEPDVQGDLFRLRVHFHKNASNRTADWSNVIVKDETGNKYDLRLSLVKFLLDKRDEGWERSGASNMSKILADARFWELDSL